MTRFDSPSNFTTHRFPSCTSRLRGELLHLTAASWIGERFMRNVDEPVLAADDFAQVDVLDGIVRLGHDPGAAWAIDPGVFHGDNHFLAFAKVALDSLQPGRQEQ